MRNKIIKYLRLNIYTLSAWAGVYDIWVLWISGGVLSYSKAFGWTTNGISLPRRLPASFHHFKIQVVWTNIKNMEKKLKNVNAAGLCASWMPTQHISHHTYYFSSDCATCIFCEMHIHLLNVRPEICGLGGYNGYQKGWTASSHFNWANSKIIETARAYSSEFQATN